MIIKNKGKINEIIYEHTVYHSGKYKMYPTLSDLGVILKELIESKSTTEYVRITPFYVNDKMNEQIEFEQYMFYIECRDDFSEEELEKHLLECIDTNYDRLDMHHEILPPDIQMGKILYPLCKYSDVEQFGYYLKQYHQYLDELLPKLFEIVKRDMDLKDNHLAFGYFCFEVNSR